MSFYEISEQLLNKAFTEKGDVAYRSTGSYCLDYFSLVGGMRFNLKEALNLFMRSYYENPQITIKILFYVRDIRSGLGERDLFRYTFNALANMYPDVAKQLIKFIPEYGRYDDLLICLESAIKNDVVAFIKAQLDEDLNNKKEGKSVSLLAKWLPSVNTSSIEARYLAKTLAKSLGINLATYRKSLSYLRKGLIIENNLREKDYTFKYENVTSGAMFKYRDAFHRNDLDRYNKYLNDVNEGKTKINTDTVYPYEVIRRLEKGACPTEYFALDTLWKNINRSKINSKTIVVRDGSGSMNDYNIVSASSVATSLAILFAESLTGEFKDKFITFSSSPKLIKIKGEMIHEKYNFISTYEDYTTTNIKSVYDLILKVYKYKDFKKEDAIDRIVIISDMEFDCMGNTNLSTFEYFEKEFKKLGFNMPEIVFWNVRARNVHFPTMNKAGVKLVSGASSKIIDSVINNSSIDAYQLMIDILEKYSCFNEIKFN